MKEKTPEQMLQEHRRDIVKEIAVWKHLQEHGGQDPFWADGCNMNLTRNHIIDTKRQIKEICEKLGWPLPEEYYMGTPPKVDNNYMANLKQKERVKRLRQQGNELTRKKVEYQEEQMSFE